MMPLRRLHGDGFRTHLWKHPGLPGLGRDRERIYRTARKVTFRIVRAAAQGDMSRGKGGAQVRVVTHLAPATFMRCDLKNVVRRSAFARIGSRPGGPGGRLGSCHATGLF